MAISEDLSVWWLAPDQLRLSKQVGRGSKENLVELENFPVI
jgi:hypothetical protein